MDKKRVIGVICCVVAVMMVASWTQACCGGQPFGTRHTKTQRIRIDPVPPTIIALTSSATHSLQPHVTAHSPSPPAPTTPESIVISRSQTVFSASSPQISTSATTSIVASPFESTSPSALPPTPSWSPEPTHHTTSPTSSFPSSPSPATHCSCCALNSGPASGRSTVELTAEPPLLHIKITAKDQNGNQVKTGQDIFFVVIRTPDIVTRLVAADHNNGTHTCSFALTGDPNTFRVSVMLAFRVSNRQCNYTMEKKHTQNPRGGDPLYPHWTDSDRLFTDTNTWAEHFDDPYLILPGSPFSLSSEDMAKSWRFDPAQDPRLYTGAFVHLDACLRHKRCLGSKDYSVMLSANTTTQRSTESLDDVWIWVPPSSYFYLFTEQEAAECLHNKHVVFAGDSLLHCLFVELDSMVGLGGCVPDCKWCFDMPCKHPNTTVKLTFEETLPRTADKFYTSLFETPIGKGLLPKLQSADHVVIGFGMWDMLEHGFTRYNQNKIPRYEAVSTYNGNITQLLHMANQTTWEWFLTPAITERRNDKLRVDLAMEYNRRATSRATEAGVPVFDYFQPTLALIEFPNAWADHVHWVGRRMGSVHPEFAGRVMTGHQFIHHYLATICPHPRKP